MRVQRVELQVFLERLKLYLERLFPGADRLQNPRVPPGPPSGIMNCKVQR